MTAGEAFDLDDAAAILTALQGRQVQRQIVSDDEQESIMAARGMLPAMIAMSLALYRAARAGEFAAVDPTLTLLMGRAPTTLREMMVGEKES